MNPDWILTESLSHVVYLGQRIQDRMRNIHLSIRWMLKPQHSPHPTPHKEEFASPVGARFLHQLSHWTDCSVTLSSHTSHTASKGICWSGDTAGTMTCIVMKSHALSRSLSHTCIFFCGGNTYCSDSVCFSSCLDFLLEKRARRSISVSCCSEWTTQWSRELIRGQKSMRRRRRTDREKEKNCNLWQRLWLSNEAELKVPEAHAKWHIPSEREWAR